MKPRLSCGVCGSIVGVHPYIVGPRCPVHPPTGDYLLKPSVRREDRMSITPYPEPSVRARALLSPVVWRSAKSYIKFLEGIGEEYDVREARGWYPNAKGEPTIEVDSISVRAWSVWGRTAAVWIDGSFEAGFILPVEGPMRLGNLDDLKEFYGKPKPDRTRAPRTVTSTRVKAEKATMR